MIGEVNKGDIVWTIHDRHPAPFYVYNIIIETEKERSVVGISRERDGKMTDSFFAKNMYHSFNELMLDLWEPRAINGSDDQLIKIAESARNEGVGKPTGLEAALEGARKAIAKFADTIKNLKVDKKLSPIETHMKLCELSKSVVPHHRMANPCAEIPMGKSLADQIVKETTKNTWDSILRDANPCGEIPMEYHDIQVSDEDVETMREFAEDESLNPDESDGMGISDEDMEGVSIECKNADGPIEEVKLKDVPKYPLELKSWFKIEDEHVKQIHEAMKKSSLFQNMEDIRQAGDPIVLDSGIKFKGGVLSKDGVKQKMREDIYNGLDIDPEYRTKLENFGDDEYEVKVHGSFQQPDGTLKTTPFVPWWSFENDDDDAILHAEYNRDQESLMAGHVHEDFWTCYCLGEEYDAGSLIWYKRHSTNEPEMCQSCKCCLQTHEDSEKTVVQVGGRKPDPLAKLLSDEAWIALLKPTSDFPPQEKFLTKHEAKVMWDEAGESEAGPPNCC